MTWKKRFKTAKRILLGVLTTLLTLIIYSYFIEPNLFVITRHAIGKSTLKDAQTFKLVQVTDLHLRNFNDRAEKIGRSINQLQPDAIVLTGDIIDRANKLKELNQFLSTIDIKVPKYATLGNWEHWSEVNLKALFEIYKSYNCQLLVNQSTMLATPSGQSVLITGLDDFTGGKPNLAASLEGIAPHPNHLLLAHSPGYRDSISPEETDLLARYSPQYMLSGHTHGGQLVFFGIAPLRPPGSGRYLSGWYKDPDVPTTLYVSRGLGVSSIPFRMGAIPEITYFEWHLQ